MNKTILSLGLGVAALTLSILMVPRDAQAVPSYARQFGKPCSACHTMWPRLNPTGREFKLSGYTSVSEEYPRIVKDNLDLLTYAPLSLSVRAFPFKKENAGRSETTIPDEVALFYAGRITNNIGAFIEPIIAPDFTFEFAKLSGYTKMGKDTLGVVAGKMDSGGADPYNTIRFTSYHTVNLPGILDEGHLRAEGSGDFFQFGSTENVGILANGKFINNSVYAAVGGYRGHSSNDPGDLFARVAYEHPISAYSNFEIGGHLYKGIERYDHSDDPTIGIYESKVNRYGADASFQIEEGDHIIDVVAIYMQGKDTDLDAVPGNDVKFKGYYGEVTYFFARTYGATLAYDYMKSDEAPSLDKKGPVVNISYVPWLNTKLSLEYSHFKYQESGEESNDDNLYFLVHMYL
jgi:hypothetical protein